LSVRSWAPRHGETRACNLGQPFVTWIGDDPEQFLDAVASDWRDDPELSKMGTDRIDHRGLLADEEMARAMEHRAAEEIGEKYDRDERDQSPRAFREDGVISHLPSPEQLSQWAAGAPVRIAICSRSTFWFRRR
jgi:hypothetical protein